MEQQKIDFILATCRDKFKPMQLQQVLQMLKDADDSKYPFVQSIDFKDPNTALIISIFAGGWGIDRFYLGDTAMGVVKLLTGGGCGILWLIDIFSIADKARDYNFQQVQMALNGMMI